MPDVTGVHIPRALNNFSIFYRNPAYIADVFSPPVSVVKESDKYFKYGLEHFSLGPALRADKARTTEITYTLSTDLYFCDRFGYKELISDRERENADDALQMDLDTTEHITECLLVDWEFRVANDLINNANPDWGSYAATNFTNLAQSWADTANADVRKDIYKAKQVVFNGAHRQANRMAIPINVAFTICQVDSLDELRKYTDPGLLTNSGLPRIFFGLEVSEAQSTYNNAQDGIADDFEPTWGNNVLICFVNPTTVSRKTLTFAISFQHKPFFVRKWREEDREADVIEIQHAKDNKIVAPACGYVFLNAV